MSTVNVAVNVKNIKTNFYSAYISIRNPLLKSKLVC